MNMIFDLLKFITCDILLEFDQRQRLKIKENLTRFIELVGKNGLVEHIFLHAACKCTILPVDLMELLLAAGADPNAEDCYGAKRRLTKLLTGMTGNTWKKIFQL